MILPENLQKEIEAHRKLVEAWFSEQQYVKLLKNNERHLLVRLAECLDLSRVEALCAGYYHQSGAGHPVVHGVKRLVRAVLVRSLYGYSLRQTEQALQTDLLIKYYVGYGLFEAGPDHSTLEDFELWLMRHHQRALFDEVLNQIEENYPAERRQVQIGDTYAMQANAAIQHLTHRLRAASQQLLESYRAAGLVNPQAALCGYAWVNLFGPLPETSEAFLNKTDRQVRLQTTVLAVLNLLERIEGVLLSSAPDSFPQVRQWVGYLHKIIRDECQVDAATVVELPNSDKGSRRIISASDPEATFRQHGTGPGATVLGYNIQVAATLTGFIHETQAYTGATSDQVGVAALVATQLEQRGSCPPKLIYDAAASHGKIRTAVTQASQGQTQIVASLPPPPSHTHFGPYAFTLSADGTALTCPNGQVTTRASRSSSGDGRDFRFLAQQCWQGPVPKQWRQTDGTGRCPLWEQCRNSRQGPGSQRQIFISDYRAAVLAAQHYNQTETFKQEKKLRPRIERIIFELTHYNGARRCQRRGLAAADFQAKLAATAYNLKLWHRKLNRASQPHQPQLTPPATG